MPAAQPRALISVYDKTGIEAAAALLADAGWEILSTGGTAAHLRSEGIAVTDVSDITAFPSILDGRVKTLHPLVFGPILARSDTEHLQQLETLEAPPISLVIVNFYPFEAALEKRNATEEEMVERIDIGGPSMVRAAAKNHERVVVVVDPADYLPVCRNLAETGHLDAAVRRDLARKAFAATAHYDALITAYFTRADSPRLNTLTLTGRRHMDLRYGENPHQAAGLYLSSPASPLRRMHQIQGKSLSYNNILDASMVWEVLTRFADDSPFCVIVKHQNPCGAAQRDSQPDAFAGALDGDPVSAYGGIVGFNTPVSKETADRLKSIFLEVVVAPSFATDAVEVLSKRPKLRLLEMPLDYREPGDIRSVPGGFVWQEADHTCLPAKDFSLQSGREPTPEELLDVNLGWRLMKFVKSNGILITRQGTLIGVGAGQMSRVDSVRIALERCRTSPEGGVLVSDAFFPFPDSLELAAERGIQVVVEPGGSIRDPKVIDAARRLNLTLLFTGMRHFRH